MRAPVVRVRDAPIAFPTTVTVPFPCQDKSHSSSTSVPLRRELPSRTPSEFVVSGVVQSHPATSRNPVSMAAQADANLHEPTESERDLAAEISRVMHRRPLINRLACFESAYVGGVQPEPASAQSGDPSSAPVISQPAAAASSPAQAVRGAPVEDIQPQRDPTSPPRSAEWLGKARRQRNRERLKNALAWLSTVAIGGTIIATTMVALQS